MKEYDAVRVIKLLSPSRHIDGSDTVKRQPKIGDTGAIVYEYAPNAAFAVENVDDDGYTIWLADFVAEELECIWEAKEVPEQIETGNSQLDAVTTQLTAAAVDAKAAFGGLTPEQLNWKPSETGWSVGQCLEHIIKTNTEFYGDFDKIASGDRRNSFWENWSPFTGMFGGFLIKTLSNDAKKVKAPSKKIVPPSDVSADIVERFVVHHAELNEKIAATANADWDKTVVTSPFLAVMTYRLSDGYKIVVAHSKRHIRQAKRVIETEGFPI